jgi:hypothetical protein
MLPTSNGRVIPSKARLEGSGTWTVEVAVVIVNVVVSKLMKP